MTDVELIKFYQMHVMKHLSVATGFHLAFPLSLPQFDGDGIVVQTKMAGVNIIPVSLALGHR